MFSFFFFCCQNSRFYFIRVVDRPGLCSAGAQRGWGGTAGGNGAVCIVYLVLGLDVELDLLARQGADSGMPWSAGQAEGVGAFFGGGGGGGFVLDVHDFWWWGEGSGFKGSFGGKLGSLKGSRMASLRARACFWSSVPQRVEREKGC